LQKVQVKPQLANMAKLVASRYAASQAPLVIKKAVEELLHQHHHEDGGDETLCKMIIDGTLHNRMCESPWHLEVNSILLGSFFTQPWEYKNRKGVACA
jgi:hypothetical protein